MRSTRPALLQHARLDDVSKVRCASLSLDTPSFMLGAVRNGMDVATLPNFVKEALASAEALRRVQNKLARQFPDQVKTKIPRSRRGTHKMRRFLPGGAAVAPAPGSNDDDNDDDKAYVSAYLSSSRHLQRPHALRGKRVAAAEYVCPEGRESRHRENGIVVCGLLQQPHHRQRAHLLRAEHRAPVYLETGVGATGRVHDLVATVCVRLLA